MRRAIVAFVFGIWCLQQMPVLPLLLWSFALWPLALLAWKLRSPHPLVPLIRTLLILVLMTGIGFFYAAGRAQVRLADSLPAAWEGQDIRVVGVVATLPQIQARGERFLFDVEQVETPDAQVPQHISIARYAPGFRDVVPATTRNSFHPGERWRLTVRLRRPHGTYNPYGFDYEAWALERDIRAGGYIRKADDQARLDTLVWRPGYLVERLRERVRDHLRQVLGDARYTGVLLALVIGDESAISAADWQVFLRTGVNHLMSISGLHVTMVASLVFGVVYFGWRRSTRLVLRLPARKAAALAGMLAAGGYALIAGYAVPTQRTFYMLSVIALALWSGRTLSMSKVLAYALLLVVLLDPWAVLAPGFWLSFGAVGLLVYAGSGRVGRLKWFKEAVHTQWVVTLGLTPPLLAMFQQVSLVSPLANAFAIPIISLVVTPLALLGAVIPIDGILWAAHTTMDWCMRLLILCAGVPGAVWQQHAPPVWTILVAMLGIFWILLPRGVPMRWAGGIAVLPMFVVLPETPANGELRATVLDVGQGLSVVLQTQHHNLLYDTGPKFSEDADSGNRVILPYLRGAGIGHLDGLILTHDDLDHTGGAASVLQGIPVGWVASSLGSEHVLLKDVAQSIPCFAGQSWQWDGVTFDMLHPEFDSYENSRIKDNDRGCVLKVTTPSGTLLLPADIERGSERQLLQRVEAGALAADVIVAPHHGSKTSSTPDFVAQVAPKVVIFTVGYRNRFGHPKKEVVQRYANLDSRLLRSDQDGAVLLDFAQNEIRIHRWRIENARYWQDRVDENAGAS